jgi:hypothetical protein
MMMMVMLKALTKNGPIAAISAKRPVTKPK